MAKKKQVIRKVVDDFPKTIETFRHVTDYSLSNLSQNEPNGNIERIRC